MRSLAFGVALALLCAGTSAEAKNVKSWATISDVGAYGLGALALGLPALHSDRQGALQAAGALGAATLVTTGMKAAFPERRPDGSDRKSFPSGHTSMAFAAASTLFVRQGAGVGIPAFAVASLVGLSRVKADKHHWYDCAVGAGVGMAAGFLITHKRPESQTALIPWGDTKEAGITFAMRF